MAQYTIVSGLKRTGTSLLMLALRQSGVPIIGFKYPYFRKDYVRMRLEDIGTYTPSKSDKNGNPNGYWEISSIATKAGLRDYYQDIGLEGDAIKVPCDMLPSSNPELVGKTIIMHRNPKTVLASHLICKPVANEEQWIRKSSIGMMHNVISSIRFLQKNNKEFIFVSYEELIKKPLETMFGICHFLNRGNYKFGAQVIDHRLNRSQPLKCDYEEVKQFEDLHKLIKNNNLEAINQIDLKEIENKFNSYDG